MKDFAVNIIVTGMIAFALIGLFLAFAG